MVNFFFGHAARGFVWHGDFAGLDWQILFAVFAVVAVALFLDGFEIKAELAYAARSVHPAGAGVESLVHEKLPPGHGTVGVEPILAGHLQFGAEEK